VASSALKIHPKELSIGAKTGDDWFGKLKPFLTHIDTLLEETPVDDEGRTEYADDLTRALNKLSRFTYLVRNARNKALADGYDHFPKGQYNSAESDAQARNYASEETSLRGLLEDLEAALKLAASLNQSALAWARSQHQHGG
jgi:hypothetical protein